MLEPSRVDNTTPKVVPKTPPVRYEISLHVVQSYIDNTTKDVNISQEDKAVFIRYYKCTLAGVVLDWLDAGASYDLSDFCEKICNSFEGSGKRAILKQLQGA